jgi:hypothetical protein
MVLKIVGFYHVVILSLHLPVDFMVYIPSRCDSVIGEIIVAAIQIESTVSSSWNRAHLGRSWSPDVSVCMGTASTTSRITGDSRIHVHSRGIGVNCFDGSVC